MSEHPTVLLIFTGGTISMLVVPGIGAVPARGGHEIVEQVPRLREYVDPRVEDFARLPGPHWSAERMLELSQYLAERVSRGESSGVVVTHGTDTLEETAYLLDLTLSTDTPIVITGAMKTGDDPAWDGAANLLAAARCAASPLAHGLGVLVVLDNVVHSAREVAKVHTEAFSAFASPRRGPLGEIDKEGVHIHRVPRTREHIPLERVESRVELIAAAAGSDGRFVRHALDTGARGIVLQALGRGNVPPGMLQAIVAADRAGVPVVVASRCTGGRTAPQYGYEGGGVTLKKAGAIFAGDLSAPKARVKLMALLGAGRDREGIRAAFER